MTGSPTGAVNGVDVVADLTEVLAEEGVAEVVEELVLV